MKSLWDDRDAARHGGDLEQRVYSSRLLGRDPALVLHGGGNTSVKVRERDLFGDEETILYVKGSGVDLATIDPAGFSPCRLSRLVRLLALDVLPDSRLMAELRACLVRADAPSPSVEAILHALIPDKFVDHTHADAVIAVMNAPEAEARMRDIVGDTVIIMPYVMPGFRLAQACRKHLAAAPGEVTGMVLMQHGLFTFGATARESYERMIELVDRAEQCIHRGRVRPLAARRANPAPAELRLALAELRRDLSVAAGVPVIVAVQNDEVSRAFVQRPDLNEISQQGAATPDHVIRTKPVPLVGRDVAGYCRAYEDYVRQHAEGRAITHLDPAPRIVLDPGLGLCAVGRSARDAAIAGDIYRHTIAMIEQAEGLGGWRPLPRRDLFEMEYWEPQLAKLRLAEARPPFAGEVALVTGAASGIGRACVDSLLAQGAAVVGLDINPEITGLHSRAEYCGLVCNLADPAAVAAALESGVRAFGGLDMLILNAGIFPAGCPIAELELATWRRVMTVNLDANFALLRACHPLLKLAPNGGRVVIIGSKNVRAPGPGASAYSVSKAAVNQLARVAALEWGRDRIRVNSIHPNMVFDTALWTPEVLASRARHYGVSVDEYRTNNVLKVTVTSADVAELAAAMCGPLFAKTTAAQVPVDGGNERVI